MAVVDVEIVPDDRDRLQHLALGFTVVRARIESSTPHFGRRIWKVRSSSECEASFVSAQSPRMVRSCARASGGVPSAKRRKTRPPRSVKKSLDAIMRQTLLKSVEVARGARGYIRHAKFSDDNAAVGLL
jgi:hypothetical protein